MEDDNAKADFAGESDSERRRRRRRKRTKKKRVGISVETAQLLRLTRWGIGVLVMLSTWGYGFYISDKLGWKALIAFPVGIAALFCIAAALSIPFVSFLAAVVLFLLKIDSGLDNALRYAGFGFAAVGALYTMWRLFVFLIVKREVTRNEAGYK